jgi:hypothetical protein
VSKERLGNVLPANDQERQATGGRAAVVVVAKPVEGRTGPAAIPVDAAVDPEAEAKAFVRFCYRRRAVPWPELYDEMCAVAARGDYRGMDYEQLRSVGIGFALAALPRLAELAARIIAEERGPQKIAAIA